MSENLKNETLYLGLSRGENFGWGVCSKYLRNELAKKLKVIDVDTVPRNMDSPKIPGKMLHALTSLEFKPLFEVSAAANFGYTFFENELIENSFMNSGNYNIVFGGSTWCVQKMNDYNINNTGLLIQGIDPELFHPSDRKKNTDTFVIFSGGKFELRKSQDIVLKAAGIMQKKYKDVYLVNSWYNLWPDSIKSMKDSPFIKFDLKGRNWEEHMRNLYVDNELDYERIITLPLVPNNKMREIIYMTDIGIFPNRCEGGTNLVMMEYMACGKPVIASFTSGHKDILTDHNSYKLTSLKEFKLFNEEKLIADWEEPSLDEVVANLEYSYINRETNLTKGENAGRHLKNYTWTNTAGQLLKQIFNEG